MPDSTSPEPASRTPGDAASIFGVDFTSTPSRRKPVTVAHGRFVDGRLLLERTEEFADWTGFETLLARPGPWIGAFDFPFGLPRAGVEALGWPRDWPALVRHCAAIGRSGLRAAFDADRIGRPPGARYPHRATDRPARSHSPFKLVNPPVGLMFLEGAQRLLAAGVSIPGMHAGDTRRIALEAYPGLLARAIDKASYKSDERRKQTPERTAARTRIVSALTAGAHPLGLPLECAPKLRDALVLDASGDMLDAALAFVQAAWAAQRQEQDFGLPAAFDPIEGWIVGC